MNQYKNLFEPIEINGLTLENRLVMTPMGTNFGEQNEEMSFLHMATTFSRQAPLPRSITVS